MKPCPWAVKSFLTIQDTRWKQINYAEDAPIARRRAEYGWCTASPHLKYRYLCGDIRSVAFSHQHFYAARLPNFPTTIRILRIFSSALHNDHNPYLRFIFTCVISIVHCFKETSTRQITSQTFTIKLFLPVYCCIQLHFHLTITDKVSFKFLPI